MFDLDKMDKIIGDSQTEVHLKFSFMLLFTFVYYTLFYYSQIIYSLDKPEFLRVIGFLCFHVVHLLGVKYLHHEHMFIEAWIAIVAPVFAYQIYKKFQERSARKEEELEAKVMAKLKMKGQGQGDQSTRQEEHVTMPGRIQEIPQANGKQLYTGGFGQGRMTTMAGPMQGRSSNPFDQQNSMSYSQDQYSQQQMMPQYSAGLPDNLGGMNDLDVLNDMTQSNYFDPYNNSPFSSYS